MKSKLPSQPTPGKSGPRPGQSATLRMVAREAGVSASTVSRIINGTVNVSPGLKYAVEAAIVKFDFRPNAAARGLALGKTSTIGVVAQAIDSPFYGEGLRGIEAFLRPRGYVPLFMSGNWREEDEERCMREFIARGVDGIIVFAGRLSDAKLKTYAKDVAVVVTGRSLRAPRLFSLQIDDRHGAMLAVRHLIEIGHRKIAFISGSENHPDAIERFEGYKKALNDAGIEFDPRLVAVGDWHEEGGLRATIELLSSPAKFTALFCVNDQTAYGACLALYRKGLSVPGDVSVIGFDDLPSSAYRLPPLTSVRQSIGELGDRSAQAILQLLDGNRPRFAPPPVELVIRESTQRAAGMQRNRSSGKT
ncbi:MAG TPA: LacI family DNA-binding transcriptional regulator [Steroidobacteraceae bacterium]|jgi:LacI family transcriptional regulator|nr:LacI family DNA-binding transcriptional regulator [Steroidobacteraceae bacterium]